MRTTESDVVTPDGGGGANATSAKPYATTERDAGRVKNESREKRNAKENDFDERRG